MNEYRQYETDYELRAKLEGKYCVIVPQLEANYKYHKFSYKLGQAIKLVSYTKKTISQLV
jgi:hypothetical protein